MSIYARNFVYEVKPVVGVLGADVLWHHQAVIDYNRGLIILSI